MEPLSVAASVLEVAGAGLKLATTLYTFAETVFHADKELKNVARDLSLTSSVIKELGTVLEQDQASRICSQNAIQTAKDTIQGCQDVSREIDAAMQRSLRSENKSKPSVPFLRRLIWPLKERRMELIRSNLEKLKSTLMLMLQVLQYAKMLNSEKTSAELQEQKTQIEALAQLNKRSTEDYNKLVKALENVNLDDDQCNQDKSVSNEDRAEASSPKSQFNLHVENIVRHLNDAVGAIDTATMELDSAGEPSLTPQMERMRQCQTASHAARNAINEVIQINIGSCPVAVNGPQMPHLSLSINEVMNSGVKRRRKKSNGHYGFGDPSHTETGGIPTVRNGRLVYKCHRCGKVYKRRENLTRHEHGDSCKTEDQASDVTNMEQRNSQSARMLSPGNARTVEWSPYCAPRPNVESLDSTSSAIHQGASAQNPEAARVTLPASAPRPLLNPPQPSWAHSMTQLAGSPVSPLQDASELLVDEPGWKLVGDPVRQRQMQNRISKRRQRERARASRANNDALSLIAHSPIAQSVPHWQPQQRVTCSQPVVAGRQAQYELPTASAQSAHFGHPEAALPTGFAPRIEAGRPFLSPPRYLQQWGNDPSEAARTANSQPFLATEPVKDVPKVPSPSSYSYRPASLRYRATSSSIQDPILNPHYPVRAAGQLHQPQQKLSDAEPQAAEGNVSHLAVPMSQNEGVQRPGSISRGASGSTARVSMSRANGVPTPPASCNYINRPNAPLQTSSAQPRPPGPHSQSPCTRSLPIANATMCPPAPETALPADFTAQPDGAPPARPYTFQAAQSQPTTEFGQMFASLGAGVGTQVAPRTTIIPSEPVQPKGKAPAKKRARPPGSPKRAEYSLRRGPPPPDISRSPVYPHQSARISAHPQMHRSDSSRYPVLAHRDSREPSDTVKELLEKWTTVTGPALHRESGAALDSMDDVRGTVA